eukprot:m.4026 g.4026  ORF g.4026 m.4026 type:complete len:50 (+) comp2159_c0_seq1:852-1001(+)
MSQPSHLFLFIRAIFLVLVLIHPLIVLTLLIYFTAYHIVSKQLTKIADC